MFNFILLYVIGTYLHTSAPCESKILPDYSAVDNKRSLCMVRRWKFEFKNLIPIENELVIIYSF